MGLLIAIRTSTLQCMIPQFSKYVSLIKRTCTILQKCVDVCFYSTRYSAVYTQLCYSLNLLQYHLGPSLSLQPCLTCRCAYYYSCTPLTTWTNFCPTIPIFCLRPSPVHCQCPVFQCSAKLQYLSQLIHHESVMNLVCTFVNYAMWVHTGYFSFFTFQSYTWCGHVKFSDEVTNQ